MTGFNTPRWRGICENQLHYTDIGFAIWATEATAILEVVIRRFAFLKKQVVSMITNRSTRMGAFILMIFVLVFSSSGCQPSLPINQLPVATPSVIPLPTAPTKVVIPYRSISEESLFTYLEDLTSIQPYSGWRNSASSGEAEAFDYVEKTLSAFSNLQNGGLELERQSFNVYLSTEIWDSSLNLTVDGQGINVPAEGMRGNRFDRQIAAYFDSDGAFDDSESDPMTTSGAPLAVQDEDTLYNLTKNDYEDRILFLDYSLIDSVTNPASNNAVGAYENSNRLLEMVNQGLSGVVFVTHFSNTTRQSHGLSIGEGDYAFGMEVPRKRIPILYVRIEDLAAAGISTWGDLQRVESAQLTLDTDVFSPGISGNVIARIPGADSSKAVILGAHIDTPNTPGALDDGSGSAALLEVARVLNDSQIKPPVDIYLAWFGSEELGIYGSSYFVSTHQELLDHTLAMVQMDGLGSPLDGINCHITMALASYDRFGDSRLLLPDFLSNAVASQGITLDRYIEHGVESDNSNFETFDVPNINLMYVNANNLNGVRPIHYYVHWHDPYDDLERARTVGAAFVDMTKVMLAAALEIGNIQPNLRVTPTPSRRALIVASHTESFGITSLRELGTALSWEGFDVDLIPYGQAITPADLKDVDIAILPPALNSPRHALEVWSETELSALKGYVESGGFLVVVNSGHVYVSTIMNNSLNLSKRSANALLEPMGIRFKFGGTSNDNTALAVSEHPLTIDATYLTLLGNNVVPFDMKTGSVLIRGSGSPLVGLVDYGTKGGQVLVIGELSILQESRGGAKNMQFIKNIAHYASTH